MFTINQPRRHPYSACQSTFRTRQVSNCASSTAYDRHFHSFYLTSDPAWKFLPPQTDSEHLTYPHFCSTWVGAAEPTKDGTLSPRGRNIAAGHIEVTQVTEVVLDAHRHLGSETM